MSLGPRRASLSGYGMLAAATLLFSTIEVVTKRLDGAVPPLRLACSRFLFTGLLLLPWALRGWRQAGRRLRWSDILVLVGLGAIGVTTGIGLYHLAIPHLQANVAAIVFSANPVVTAVLAPALLKERLNPHTMASAVFGVLGIAAFVADAGGITLRAWNGVWLMVGAVFGFSIYTILGKRCIPAYGAAGITAAASLAGGLLLLPLSLWQEGLPRGVLTLRQWALMGYLVLVATLLGYVLFFFGLQRTAASQGAMLFFLKPTAAALLAWWWLGEGFTPLMVAGTSLILLALACVMLPGLTAAKRALGR